MVTAGTVEVPGWPRSTQQPGDALRDIFTRMGAAVRVVSGRLVLTGPREILPLDMDLHDVGELVPTVAAVAAFATGTSALRNIGQLRGHETDRLNAITTELNRLGGKAWVEGDDLFVEPTILHGARLETYEDHRMATFAAVIGLRVPGVDVVDIETTSKTLPQFPQMWADLVAGEASVRALPQEIPLSSQLPATGTDGDL